MKRILCGFDASESAGTALLRAAAIAKAHAGSLTALYVEDERHLQYVPFSVALAAAVGVSPRTPQPLPAEEMLDALSDVEQESARVRKEFNARIEPLLQDLQKSLYQIPELLVERGLPWEQLAARTREVDLVVMGRVGRDAGLKDLAGPETTETLASHIVTPLLLIAEHSEPPLRALLAFDGSEAAQRAMRSLPPLVAPLGIESIYVLSVPEHGIDCEALGKTAMQYLSQCGVEVESVIRSGDVAENISSLALQRDCGLVAAGAFGSRGVRRLVWGSATEELLARQEFSLLLSR